MQGWEVTVSVLPWGLYSRAAPPGSASSLPGPGQHRQGNGLDECEPPVPGATVTTVSAPDPDQKQQH